MSNETVVYTAANETSIAGTLLAWLFITIFTTIVYAYMAIILMKVFKKANTAGWKAWVPLVNNWALMEISGKPGWWGLVGLIPMVGSFIQFILAIVAYIDLSKKFGKSTSFAILGLVILPLVGFSVLAFDKSVYDSGEVAQVPVGQPTFIPGVATETTTTQFPQPTQVAQQPVPTPQQPAQQTPQQPTQDQTPNPPQPPQFPTVG